MIEVNVDKGEEEAMIHFTKRQLAKMWTEGVKTHTKLVKWLYDNHKAVLREFEKENYGGMQIEFLGGKDGIRKTS